MLKEFSHFVREKGVIGLAVGLVVGSAVTVIVNKLVADFVSPLIAWVTGASNNIGAMTWTVPGTSVTFLWGDFVMSLVNFLAIMLTVYLVFVKSPLNKLDKKVD